MDRVAVLLAVVAVFVAASPQRPPKVESLPPIAVNDPAFALTMEAHTAGGPTARDIAEALAERCRAGVEARVLRDGFGTMAMPRAYATLMTEAGCHAETFRPIPRIGFRRHNYRNHRRLLVVVRPRRRRAGGHPPCSLAAPASGGPDSREHDGRAARPPARHRTRAQPLRGGP